ncbi:MAG: response regulator [Candidatus Omnitrophica bacterium]|nr:response regulator [Candidatus Omnitrophota bacterium]
MDTEAKKILLIDDDPLVRKSVENILKRMKYNVTSAGDADEAFKAIEKSLFDLIISDIRMPGKNGVETIREIRRTVNSYSSKDIPIIFITGYAESSDELKAEILGEVILKPFDIDHLLVTIREYL